MGTNGCLKMKEGEPLKRDNSVTQHSQFLSVAHLFDSTNGLIRSCLTVFRFISVECYFLPCSNLGLVTGLFFFFIIFLTTFCICTCMCGMLVPVAVTSDRTNTVS